VELTYIKAVRIADDMLMAINIFTGSLHSVEYTKAWFALSIAGAFRRECDLNRLLQQGSE